MSTSLFFDHFWTFFLNFAIEKYELLFETICQNYFEENALDEEEVENNIVRLLTDLEKSGIRNIPYRELGPIYVDKFNTPLTASGDVSFVLNFQKIKVENGKIGGKRMTVVSLPAPKVRGFKKLFDLDPVEGKMPNVRIQEIAPGRALQLHNLNTVIFV